MLNLNLDLYSNPISNQFTSNLRKFFLKSVMTTISCLMVIAVMMTLPIAPSMAALPTKSAIKDPRVILRNSLPIENEVLRDVQHTLEQMPRLANLKRWNNLKKDVETIARDLTQNKSQLIAEVNNDRQVSITEHLYLYKKRSPLKIAIMSRL